MTINNRLAQLRNRLAFLYSRQANPLLISYVEGQIKCLAWAIPMVTKGLNKTVEYIDGEEWFDIPEYDHNYMVSNMGRVKSMYKGNERIIVMLYIVFVFAFY